MISDITIGQYFPGKSFVHKMDARIKIVLTVALIVLAFLCKNFYALLAMTAIIVALVPISKISFKTIFKSIKPLLVIILITAIINLFYGSGEPLVQFWVFKITLNGIKTAVFMAVRIIALVVISSLLTYTTSPTNLTSAMESLMKPLKLVKVDVHSIAMTMTIALRFIPTLIEEIDKIMSAQKSRGADLDSGGLIHRAKALIPILIPLFVSSFKRADELAYAMECRCYTGGNGRTKMNTMKMSYRDVIAFLFVVLCFVGVILLNKISSAVI